MPCTNPAGGAECCVSSLNGHLVIEICQHPVRHDELGEHFTTAYIQGYLKVSTTVSSIIRSGSCPAVSILHGWPHADVRSSIIGQDLREYPEGGYQFRMRRPNPDQMEPCVPGTMKTSFMLRGLRCLVWEEY